MNATVQKYLHQAPEWIFLNAFKEKVTYRKLLIAAAALDHAVEQLFGL